MEIKLKDCGIKIKKEVILQNLNFELQPGKFYHLFGENGAGKSVFLQGLLGLTPFFTGAYEIHYDKADLCYVTSIPFYFDNETVSSVVKLLAKLYRVDLATLLPIIEHLNLDYEQIKSKKMNELSQGMRQKIVVLPIFLKDVSFFVLDEIFTGFDQVTQQKVINRLCELAEQKKTVLFVEHNIELMGSLAKSIEMERFVCKKQTVIPD